MPGENLTDREGELLSYVIASGDMRFIEINERTLVVHHDPTTGPVIRGELAECGPDCDIDLGHAFLEYAMSCGDCREAAQTARAADAFGRHLGDRLSESLFPPPSPESSVEALVAAMSLLLRSMDVPYQLESTDAEVHVELSYCPLRATAAKAAMTVWVAPASRALYGTIKAIVNRLAPAWQLRAPTEHEAEEPIREILIQAT